MIVALVTFAVGLAAGYLAQRSRLCFIGGLRDFLLVRDTDLLQGALAFFLAAWLAFPLAGLAGLPVWTTRAPAPAVAPAAASPEPAPPAQPVAASPAPAAGARTWAPALLAVLAGLGLGATATLANGCPLRQHVLAAQGAGDAEWWLGGFYTGAVVYHAWFLPLLAPWLP